MSHIVIKKLTKWHHREVQVPKAPTKSETIKFGVSPCFSQRFWRFDQFDPQKNCHWFAVSWSSPPIWGINLKYALLPGYNSGCKNDDIGMCSHHFSSVFVWFRTPSLLLINHELFNPIWDVLISTCFFFLIPCLVPKILAELPGKSPSFTVIQPVVLPAITALLGRFQPRKSWFPLTVLTNM